MVRCEVNHNPSLLVRASATGSLPTGSWSSSFEVHQSVWESEVDTPTVRSRFTRGRGCSVEYPSGRPPVVSTWVRLDEVRRADAHVSTSKRLGIR